MNMHFAPTERRMEQRIPICGYMNPIDEICRDPELCTCPECRDCIIDPDTSNTQGEQR